MAATAFAASPLAGVKLQRARPSRRAAPRAPRRWSARRRACSSSGPSARDDRGAADQGASRALGVAACAADLGDTAEVDAAPPRAAAPSRHARRSMFGKETSRCVACETPKVWSVDRFKCPTDQHAGNRKFRGTSFRLVPIRIRAGAPLGNFCSRPLLKLKRPLQQPSSNPGAPRHAQTRPRARARFARTRDQSDTRGDALSGRSLSPRAHRFRSAGAENFRGSDATIRNQQVIRRESR